MTQRKTVCLDFYSTYEMLDFVQVASDHLGRLAGLDDDALHWVGVAVRESVINAIKHGNRDDERKHVYVEFTPLSNSGPAGIAIRVRDEGPGFDPTTIPDPLAPENVLKSSGRGIFIIRTFMDEMVLRRAPEGGMEVVMVKRVAAGDHAGFAVASALTPPDPVFLATAVEIVLRAGEIQMSRRESGFQIDKKGTIDLVTEVDLECEKMCRAVLAERFPHHDILAEELSSGPGQPRTSRYRWVFDPLDGTTNYAHGLPVFCASLALEIDGRAEVGAIYDPTRKELFTGERGQGAFVNGTRLTSVGDPQRCSTHCSSLASRTTSTRSSFHSSRCSAHSSGRHER